MYAVLWLALLGSAVQADFCGEVFPAIFYNTTYTTTILAGKAMFSDSSYVYINMGGSTMNPDLVESTTPLSHERAWVASYRQQYTNQSVTDAQMLQWFKYFKGNTDFKAVISLDQNRRNEESQRELQKPGQTNTSPYNPLLAIVETTTPELYFVLIDNKQGWTVRQYKLTKFDGTTYPTSLTIPAHLMDWHDAWQSSMLFYIPFNQVNANGAHTYGMVRFDAADLGNSQVRHNFMLVFACPNAVSADQCQVHSMVKFGGDFKFSIGGVRTDDGTALNLFLHYFENNNLKWTLEFSQPQGVTHYHVMKRLAANDNVCWGVSQPSVVAKPIVFYITRRDALFPTDYEIFDFPIEVEEILAASLFENGALNTKFAVLTKHANSSSILFQFQADNHIVWQGDFNLYPGDSSGYIANSVFDDFHAGTQYRDLIVFGNANALSFSNFTWSGTRSAGFITPINHNGLFRNTFGSLFTSFSRVITDETATFAAQLTFKNNTELPVDAYNKYANPDCLKLVDDPNVDNSGCSCNNIYSKTLDAFATRMEINSLFSANSMSLASNVTKMSPNVIPFLFYGPEHTNMSFQTSPGLFYIENESPFSCDSHFKLSSILTTFANGTSTNSYPTAYDVQGTGSSQIMAYYFTDNDYRYVGNMTVNHTMYFIDQRITQSVIFNLIRTSYCESTHVLQEFNLTNVEHNLFQDTSQYQNWTTTSNNYTVNCSSVAFTVSVLEVGSTTWVALASSDLAIGNLAQLSGTSLKFMDDIDSNSYAEYHPLANRTFEIRISTVSDYTKFWGGGNDGIFSLTLHGCIVTPVQQFTNMSIVVMQDTDVVQTVDAYDSSCGGSMIYNLYQQWNGGIQIEVNQRIILEKINSDAQVRLTMVSNQFANNQFSQNTYAFSLVAKVYASFYSNQTGNQFAQYHHEVYFTVVANCSGTPFYLKSTNAAAFLPLTSEKQIYTLTDPAINLTISKFLSIDRYCNQTIDVTVQRVNSDGSLTALSSSDRDLLGTFYPDTQLSESLNHYLAILQDWFLFEGNFTVTVSSAVTEHGGQDTDQFSFDLEVRHWCYKSIIQTTAIADFDYYIQDTSHPLLDQSQQPKVVPIPKFTSNWSYNGVTYSDTNNLTASCGPWNHQMFEVLANGTEVPLSHSAFTVDLADANSMSISVSSTDKSLVNSTTGFTRVSLKLYGHMGVYFDHNSSISFDVYLRDPCFLVSYSNSTEFPIEMFYQPNFPPTLYLFDAFIDTVNDTSLANPSGQIYIGQRYCGAQTYEILYEDRMTPYNDEFMTFMYDSGKQQGSILLYTTDSSYQQTYHRMVLKVLNSAYQQYPALYYSFAIQLGNCKLTQVTPPTLNPIVYLLKTGAGSFTYPANYVQVPDCKYEFSLSAQWKNGTSLKGSVVQFSFDQATNDMNFLVTAEGKDLIGNYQMQVTFTISNSFEQFTDSSLLVDLKLKYQKFKLDHLPPSYQDESAIPKQIRMKTGDVIEFSTGAASEDTIKSFIEVKADRDSWKDFITIEEKPDIYGFKVTIAPTLSDHRGSFQIRITLEDNGSDSKDGPGEDYYGETLTKLYKVSLTIITEVNSTFEGVVIEEEVKEENKTGSKLCFKDCEPRMELASISQSAQVVFKFDRDMSIPEAYSAWDNEIVDVSVFPGQEQNSSFLNFTWNVTDFQSQQLKLKLYFDNPIRVSTGDTKDILQVKFLRPSLLVDTKYGNRIKVHKYRHKLPMQMDQSASSQNQAAFAENLEKSMNSVVFSNLAINIVMSSSLQFLWGMINALSINLHLPAMNVKMPGNAQAIQSMLVTITQFELIPEDYLKYFYIFQKSEEEEENPESELARMLEEQPKEPEGEELYQENNLSQMGYDSNLMLDNLQTVFIMMEIYFFLLMALAVLRLLSFRFPSCKKRYRWLFEQLLWNMVFRFLIEMYLELAFDCLVNLNPKYAPPPSSVYEWVSYSMSWICLCILIAFPTYILIFFCIQPEDKLKEDNTLFESQGSLYEGLKLRGKQGKYYYLFFMFRRMQMAVFIVYFSDYAWFQLQMSLATSTVMILYNGMSRPWDERFLNKLELVNETSVLMMTYHLLMFTDYYRNVEVTYFVLGNSYIYCTFITICLNTSVIIQEFIRSNYAKYKKQRKIKNYLKRVRELRNMVEETEKITGVNTVEAKKKAYLNALRAQERINDQLEAAEQKGDHGAVAEDQSESVSDLSLRERQEKYHKGMEMSMIQEDSLDSQEDIASARLKQLTQKQKMIQKQLKDNMFMCQIKELTDPNARPNRFAQYIMEKEKAARAQRNQIEDEADPVELSGSQSRPSVECSMTDDR